jgi:hypothetical protein
MRILANIIISSVLIYSFEKCTAEEKPVPIACGPFAFPVSPAYPFVVYSISRNGKEGARLIERPLNHAIRNVELILGCTGATAIERTKSEKPDQPDRERELGVADSSALKDRLLTSLEKHHGAQLLHKLKSNFEDKKDLTWTLHRDDYDDLLATLIILDAIHTMERGKQEVEKAGADQPATAPESKPDGSQRPQPESKPASR